MKTKKIREGFMILLFWIAIWWGIALIVNRFYVPSPLETSKVLFQLLAEKNTYVILISTISRVLFGLIIGVGLGLIFGVLAGMKDWLYKLLQPIITTIKSTPVVSFIILLIIFVSDEFVPSLLGIMICFPIIYNNVVEGYRVVDKQLIEMSTVYKVPVKRRILKLYIPSTIPYLAAGILTSIGICWKGTIAAEVIGLINNSIGNELYNGKVYMEYDHVFAWTFLIIICSLTIELLTKRMIRKLKYYERLEVKS